MDSYDPDLPDELQGRTSRAYELEEQAEPSIDRQERLDNLSSVIARYRDEAVKARKASGIEDIWGACEDAYLGIDDQNRPDDRAKWSKPTSMVGPISKDSSKNGSNKSTAFVRLTSRYVDMGAAKISEIILPIDDKAFSFGPTPVPDLISRQGDMTPLTGPDGQPLMRNPTPEEAAQQAQQQPPAQPPVPGQPPAPPPQPQPVPMTVADLAKMEMRKATDAADKAEERVYDWMVESRYPMQMRKVMHDAARIGVGVLKGPFPQLCKSQSFSIESGVPKLTSISKVIPACKWISPWDFYPHKSCGEDIHCGDYVVELDHISESGLRALKEEKEHVSNKLLYISGQIDKVIEEGPQKSKVEGRNPAEKTDSEQYRLWRFYGTLKRKDFLSFEPAIGDEDLPEELQQVFAIVTMVNDTVIQATLNPMESGKFPFRAFPWSRRAGSWAGVGVAEQVSLPQSIVNAGTRRLLDNAGISSGAQIVLRQKGIVPSDGSWTITPDKLWFATEEVGIDDVKKAFMSITFPNLGEQLMAVIQYGMTMAEEQSNIPLISQGKNGPQDPQTFGQAELQNSNANSLLRNIAYGVDDCITEPFVTDLYEWLLLDPDVPDDEKGDFKINAHGSIAMVEKSIQEQTLAYLLGLARDPSYEMNPAKVAKEFVLAKRIDPRKLEFTEEEKQAMAQRQAPEAPAIAAAKIRAESSLQIAQAKNETDLQKVKADTDRDTVYVQAEMARSQAVQQAQMAELQLKREIANLTYQTKLMEFSQAEKISLQEAKTKLAEVAMKLNVQKELSAASMGMDAHKTYNPPQVATPPSEPAGRAAPGRAYEQ